MVPDRFAYPGDRFDPHGFGRKFSHVHVEGSSQKRLVGICQTCPLGILQVAVRLEKLNLHYAEESLYRRRDLFDHVRLLFPPWLSPTSDLCIVIRSCYICRFAARGRLGFPLTRVIQRLRCRLLPSR